MAECCVGEGVAREWIESAVKWWCLARYRDIQWIPVIKPSQRLTPRTPPVFPATTLHQQLDCNTSTKAKAGKYGEKTGGFAETSCTRKQEVPLKHTHTQERDRDRDRDTACDRDRDVDTLRERERERRRVH